MSLYMCVRWRQRKRERKRMFAYDLTLPGYVRAS